MQDQPQNKKLVLKLTMLVIGMFGFGFALVPLYDVFCDITGINGKTSNEVARYENVTVDKSRQVTIQFITRTHSNMPWDFHSTTKKVTVYPGEMNQVDFYAKNNSNRAVIGQAIPSVAPGQAALFLEKTECFCFNQQPLNAGEETLMPMKFFVNPDLPEDINFFTLSYTLYDITDSAGVESDETAD